MFAAQRNTCGSGLARDDGGSVTADVDCHCAIAGKPHTFRSVLASCLLFGLGIQTALNFTHHVQTIT